MNAERKVFYQLCWHLGASQGDIANLRGEDVDWGDGTIGFQRKKTGVPVIVHLGRGTLELLNDLPGEGPLFPYLRRVRSGDRATEFRSRCRQLGILGVSLHSYRYAWAERAKVAGYPERDTLENRYESLKTKNKADAERLIPWGGGTSTPEYCLDCMGSRKAVGWDDRDGKVQYNVRK